MIGVLCALPFEAGLFKVLTYAQNDSTFLIHTTGMGAERAKRGVEFLIKQSVTAIVSFGTAGGLDPSLQPGQLIIPDQILDEKKNIFLTDISLKKIMEQKFKSHLPIMNRAILQTDHIITSILHKKNLFSQYEAAAVDMESVSIAAAAKNAALPFAAARVIFDTATMCLPHWLPHVLNDNGSLQKMKFIKQAILHPDTWGSLFNLYRNFAAIRFSMV